MSEKLYTKQEVLELLAMKNAEIERLKKLTITDSATGLYNLQYVNLEVKRIISCKKRQLRDSSDEHQLEYVCLSFIDIDRLKAINDTYGHAVGDLAIRRVGGILRNIARGSDIVARLHGDEFVVITFTTNHKGCDLFVERLRKSLTNITLNLGHNRKQIIFSTSIGRKCTVLSPEFSFKKLREEADSEMYVAKKKK